MFLRHAHNLGYLFIFPKQSCQLPIHRPNKGMRQKNVLHAWNKITSRAGRYSAGVTRTSRRDPNQSIRFDILISIFGEFLLRCCFERIKNVFTTSSLLGGFHPLMMTRGITSWRHKAYCWVAIAPLVCFLVTRISLNHFVPHWSLCLDSREDYIRDKVNGQPRGMHTRIQTVSCLAWIGFPTKL